MLIMGHVVSVFLAHELFTFFIFWEMM